MSSRPRLKHSGRETINGAVLIVTNHEDITTDFVVLELKRRSIPFVRLNTEHLADSVFRYSPDRGPAGFELVSPSTKLSFGTIGAGYFRRPGLPVAGRDVQGSAERQYC